LWVDKVIQLSTSSAFGIDPFTACYILSIITVTCASFLALYAPRGLVTNFKQLRAYPFLQWIFQIQATLISFELDRIDHPGFSF
jgi:hypothetical protein